MIIVNIISMDDAVAQAADAVLGPKPSGWTLQDTETVIYALNNEHTIHINPKWDLRACRIVPNMWRVALIGQHGYAGAETTIMAPTIKDACDQAYLWGCVTPYEICDDERDLLSWI